MRIPTEICQIDLNEGLVLTTWQKNPVGGSKA